MTEAIFGIIGVITGSAITWFQSYWTNKKTEKKNAEYLAVRIVCILNKYIEDCSEVVNDDGLKLGQRNSEGNLAPQVTAPQPPIYPDDVDWRSIEPDLMYKILSFPSEIISGNKSIDFANDLATAPDFEEWFEERRFQYAQFGITASSLSAEICEKYGIKKKVYMDWNPLGDLKEGLAKVEQKRHRRAQFHQNLINKASS